MGWRRRLDSLLRRTWVLGALVALASWDVVFSGAAPGNDGNWVVGLYLASEEGLRFGEELIFTYGPLGFLSPLSPDTGGLAVLVDPGRAQLAFLYGSAIHVLLCLSLVWALRPRLGAVAAVLLTFGAIAAFPAMDSAHVLAAVWCLAVLADESPLPRRVVSFGGGVLAAFESLVRLTSGPVILGMCIVALAAAGRPRRDLPPLLGTFAVALTALWLAAGQALGNVPDYVASGAQVVLGYSQGMARAEAGLEWDLAEAAGALAVLGLGACAFLTTAPRRRQLAAAVVVLLPGFVAFKEGIVREDRAHLSILFATALGLALAIPWRRERRLAAGAAVAALTALAFVVSSPRPGGSELNPVEHADSAVQGARTLLSEDRRSRLETAGRTFVTGHAALDGRTLSLLDDGTVHVDPSGAGVVWGYFYDWRPLPVFQENLAYTSGLDEENADYLASEDGPARILRGTPEAIEPGATEPIDGRFSAWNPPRVAVTMLCRLRPLHATDRWQVLERRPDRCGAERALTSVETGYGEVVEVPRAGPREAVIARIHGADVSGLERLRSLLFRPRLRFLTVNGEETYRLVPDTADDGLIVSVPPRLDFAAPFSLSPAARTIELSGAGGDLTVDFFALALRR